MISAILIDDMRPALRELEYLLKKYPDIFITGVYTDPITALEKVGEQKPQVVFLDIHMPQLQGIDAGSKILDLSPQTDIVFVTAFDQYALEAFELHALDYLLKPIDEKRLEKTIARLRQKSYMSKEQPAKNLLIRCFGRFQLRWYGQVPVKWRSEKNRELFAYLLQNAERSISKDELLDQLWPEGDHTKALRQLYNGIYYIRKTLQDYGIDHSLISIDSTYNLNLGPVDLDVSYYDEFEKGHYTESIEALEGLEALYQGDYLETEYYSWADFERERLSILHLQCLTKLAQLYLKQKDFAKAESKLLKAYRRNPYEERVTELLLRLYIITGEKTKAIKQFEAYSTLIKDELGIKPSQELVALYQVVTDKR
ncbi:response regulator [Heliorestis convoluta]|uniref:Stage 0 sporulation protein A homolog n=1 Tax=Heliorestis convoluta TaxID=356322 RepID=A0A5Q2MY03_9FIRM|nr:response regulator [Heliorestis convoluta]QGG47578.1 Hypothetical protein FTV88_1431 [Heliorestis convoluta]